MLGLLCLMYVYDLGMGCGVTILSTPTNDPLLQLSSVILMVVYASYYIQFLICHNISEGILLSWPSSVILYLYISVTSSGTTALSVANLCDYLICVFIHISLCAVVITAENVVEISLLTSIYWQLCNACINHWLR